MVEDKELLALMLKDQVRYGQKYGPTRAWANSADLFSHPTREGGLASYRIASTDMVVGDKFDILFGLWKARSRKPVERTWGNNKVIQSYFESFSRIAAYSKRVDFSRVSSILEIGGGCGTFCHAVMRLFPDIRQYIYLDLPPVLYMATQYFKHFFGRQVVDYRTTRSEPRIRFSQRRSREIIMLCPWQLERVNAHTDLFWNSDSFQFMLKSTIIQYAKQMAGVVRSGGDLCLVFRRGDTPGGRSLAEASVIKIVQQYLPSKFLKLKSSRNEGRVNSCYFGKVKAGA